MDEHVKIACFREAGRAIAHVSRHIGFDKIEVDPLLGSHLVPDPHQRRPSPATELLLAYAGPVAEQLYTAGPTVNLDPLPWNDADYNPNTDTATEFDIASRYRRVLGLSDRPDQYEIETRRLLTTWWPALQTLASELQDKGQLGYRDVLLITGMDED